MLEEEPDLPQYLICFWNVLSSSRNSGMGLGAIPLPAYESYFRIFGVDSLEEQLDYLKFVGALDSTYLEWHSDENEKKRQEKECKSKTQGRTAKR